MKKFLSLLLMMVLAIGTAWAAETVYYTLDGTETGGTNGYATESEITQNSMTWMVTGNTTTNPWRIGGKNLSGVDREVYSTTSMPSAISKVSLELGSATLTVNSVKLTVASDDAFSTVLDELTVNSPEASTTIEFTPTSGSEWATGAYYKFTFNVTAGSSNQYVQFVGAKFYKTTGGDDPTPTTYNVNIAEMTNGTVTANPASAAENATVTLTVAPANGYKLYEIAAAYGATNVALTTVTEGAEYTFTMPASEVTVTATFVEDGGDTPTPGGAFYTLDGTETGGTNGYATESEITQNSMTWMVTGNTTTDPWRIGGKNLSGVDREVYSTTSMPSAISKVSLELGSATLTVNSVKLTVASDAAFSTVLDELTVNSPEASTTIEFTPTSGSEWATGAYYKFTFNVTAGSSNQYVQFVGAKFYAGEGGDTPVTVAAPTFDPAAGAVAYGTTVTITAAEGCVVAMTTDGTDPTESETAYVSDGNVATYPITQEVTIKAAAMDGDLNFSNVVTAAYTLILPDAPTFSPAAGAVEEGTEVTITSPANTTVTYTTDGTDPIESSTALTADGNEATVTVNEAMTIKAVTMDENGLFSEVATAAYTIAQPEQDAQPGESVIFEYGQGKEFAQNNSEEMVDSQKKGITIDFEQGTSNNPPKWYSSTNGNARVYNNNTITITAPSKIESVTFTYDGTSYALGSSTEVDPGTFASSTSEGVWTVGDVSGTLTVKNTARISTITVKLAEEGAVDLPEITGATSFVGSTTVTITAVEGADIYYTTDGGDPSAEDALYTEPFEITETTTVKAIAVLNGKSSNVASVTFTAVPTVTSIAEFNALTDTDVVGFENPVVAIAQTGNYLYAQDDNNGILIFGQTGQEYTLGQVIPAGFVGKKATYGGAPELSNPANFKAAESTVQVTPLELTPAQINDVNEVTYGSYFGRYAVIKGATVASNAVTVDGESVTTYNRFGVSAPSDSEGKTYNVFGVVGYYNAVQFMPLEYAEVQEPAGVTLAEALAGEDGDVTITDDLKVVVVNSAYAILSDGNDNWIKVTGADDLEQNQVVTDVKGTITLSLNPVMNVNSFTESDNEVNVELDRLDLRTIHREALTALKPNEVATFVGYYNAETGELCAFSSGSGLHIGMSTDYMVGTISAGKQQAITGVVSLKEAWDVPTTNAPARVAIDDDQAFENIQIDAASASTPTGIADVKTLDGKEIQGIYNVNGQQVSRADKGVYIIRYTDGTAAKVRF